MNLKTKVTKGIAFLFSDTRFLSEKMFSECCFPDTEIPIAIECSKELNSRAQKIDQLETFWKLFVRSGSNITTFHPH